MISSCLSLHCSSDVQLREYSREQCCASSKRAAPLCYFIKKVFAMQLQKLNMDASFLDRNVNEGFSGNIQ